MAPIHFMDDIGSAAHDAEPVTARAARNEFLKMQTCITDLERRVHVLEVLEADAPHAGSGPGSTHMRIQDYGSFVISAVKELAQAQHAGKAEPRSISRRCTGAALKTFYITVSTDKPE